MSDQGASRDAEPLDTDRTMTGVGESCWSAGRRFAFGGGALALSAGLCAVCTILPPSAWLRPGASWRGLAPVVVVYSTLVLLVSAPLAGTYAVTQRRRTRSFRAAGRKDGAGTRGSGALTVTILVGWTAAFVVATALQNELIGWLAGEDLRPVPVAAFMVQAAGGLAISLGSALMSLRLRHGLDAAGLAVCVSLLGSLGILLAGSYAEQVPRVVAEWVLGGSPLMAVARAADIDLLRTDVLYQISPLAHMSVNPPHWSTVTSLYVLSALLCSAVIWLHSWRPRHSLGETPFGKDLP